MRQYTKLRMDWKKLSVNARFQVFIVGLFIKKVLTMKKEWNDIKKNHNSASELTSAFEFWNVKSCHVGALQMERSLALVALNEVVPGQFG